MGFWRKRWDDIRGNLLWQVVVWVFGGGLLTAGIQAYRTLQSHPLELHFVLIVFLISALALAVVMLLASRASATQLQPSMQTLASPAPPAQLTIKAIDDLYGQFDRRITNEIEGNIRKQASTIPSANDRESFLIRGIVIGAIFFDFESIWYGIFGSQIGALQELNGRSLQRHELLPHYTAAAMDNPNIYANYSFDQWIGWMRTQVLLREDGHLVSITVKGREFLKYLIGEGRSAAGKAL